MSRFVVLIVGVAFIAGFACTAVNQPEAVPERQKVAAAEAPPAAPPAPVGATLLEGLGNYHRAITTNSPEAQRWFDQGLMLAYGFNHDAAERSFLKGIEADSDCAMCWWGAALVLGPHVNAQMDAGNNAKAWMRTQKARALAPRVDLWEQAFIETLSARYAEQPPADRSPLDRAYANAMERLARQLPDDVDAATMYAEALMDLQPWNYYDAKGKPKGNTPQIVATLESVMARDPQHAGALHLYIHAVEASDNPDRGAVAADRLRELVPGSGHLVHMPAHIYTRVGRYHDAAVANQKAIKADDIYLATCKPAPGVYPLGYVPHNHHFLWWASSMEGASVTALAAAEETAKRAYLPDLIKAPGFEFLQDFWVTPLKAKSQFGRWDEIVATPKPPDDMPYPVAIWHYAQGMAAAKQQRVADAQGHLAELAKAAGDPKFDKYMVGPQQPLSRTLKVAERLLAGTVALAAKDQKAAIAALKQAVAEEDANPYFEPPLWHESTRVHLGAALIAAGRAGEAEAVYREDLKHNRDSGWAWRGLAQSLKAQGKKKQAAEAEAKQRKAWQYADLTLTASTQ
jgi:tetratricopeptide (TPR) repeat protein